MAARIRLYRRAVAKGSCMSKKATTLKIDMSIFNVVAFLLAFSLLFCYDVPVQKQIFPTVMKRSSSSGMTESRRVVQSRWFVTNEGHFGVGLNEWLHRVKKQGGTALHAVRRCGPRPAQACVVPGHATCLGLFYC